MSKRTARLPTLGPRPSTLDPQALVPWSLGPLALLCAAAFLTPLIGGTVPVDAGSMQPGYTPLMKSIFGGADTPILSHFVVSLLICSAAAWTLVTRRVIQVPMPYLGVAWIGFFGLVAASAVFSAFLFTSIPTALEWVVYGIGGLAVVAIVGRKSGPKAVLSSLVVGCSLLALIGLLEYFGSSDPTWRIFATWQNPNALAGMLLIGLFSGLGLTLSLSRGAAGAAGAGTALIGCALALTQSKGAFLAAAVGLAAVVVLGAFWLRKEGAALRVLGRASLCLAAIAAFLFILRLAPEESGPSAPLSRLTQAGETQEQSAGFRSLLWKGTARLMQEKPLGWGIGSYRFESARPGLTTQTHFAHNSYLQLGAESGIQSLAFLAALAVLWFAYTLKGARKHDTAVSALRVGVFSAVIAAGAHSVVDSDLHYFGTGLSFFLLLGLGLQLSSDGVTPESVLPATRWSTFAACLITPLVLFYFGAIEATKAHVRHNLQAGSVEDAQEGVNSLRGVAGGDGEVWYLSSVMAPDLASRGQHLSKAAERAPSTRNLRALARHQSELGRTQSAAETLLKALDRDPNNLLTLLALMDLWLSQGNSSEALRVAQRLVAVEETSYFKTRALPELVPTETYFARNLLAENSISAKDKVELLEPAFQGLLEYASRTVPNVASAAEAGMPSYGGETPDDARRKLTLGKEVAKGLASAYRELGEPAPADEVEAKAAAFEDAAASLP